MLHKIQNQKFYCTHIDMCGKETDDSDENKENKLQQQQNK